MALLDYTLPGWDCRAALSQLLAARPALPVISVAGTIGEETAVEMLKLGAADYVAKDHLARLPFVVGRALEAASDHRARLAAESALRASETRYRRMVETAAEGILVADEDFVVVFCNERMVAMLGYGPAVSWAGTPPISTSPKTPSSGGTRRRAAAPGSPSSTRAASAAPTVPSSGSTSRRRRSSTTMAASPVPWR